MSEYKTIQQQLRVQVAADKSCIILQIDLADLQRCIEETGSSESEYYNIVLTEEQVDKMSELLK